MDQNDDYLVHYGVLGMKWGVRKDRDRAGHRKSSGSSNKKNTSQSEHDALNRSILKKNPNAAVLNPDLVKKAKKDSKKELTEEERKARNKKIAIAVLAGVGTVSAVAAVAYVANKTNNSNRMNLIKASPHEEVWRMRDELKDHDVSDFVKGWIKVDEYRYKEISLDAYEKLGKNDLKLKKGTFFQRISNTAEATVRDNTYVAFGSDDKNRYKAFLPGMWRANGRRTTDVYKVVMEAGEEIRSPSAKKRVDILETVFKKNPDLAKRAASAIGEKSTGNESTLARKLYNQVATGLANRDSDFSKAYIKEVLNQGYNAIIDDNDAGRLAKNPLILLTSKSIKSVKSTKVTGQEILDAAKSINKQAFDIKNNALNSRYNKNLIDYLADNYLKSIAEVAQSNGALSKQVINRITTLKNSGKTIEEISKLVGVAAATVSKYAA